MTGAAWRAMRQQGEEIELSTGDIVRVRSVPLGSLVESGAIPDHLTPLVYDTIWAKPPTMDQMSQDAELTKRYFELVNLVVKAALVTWRVVDFPQAENEISIDDLDMIDRQRIYNSAVIGVQWMRSFRPQQGGNVEVVSDLEDAIPAAQ